MASKLLFFDFLHLCLHILLLILPFTSCVAVSAQRNNSALIKLDSSIFPTTYPTSWLSSSGNFAFGFYKYGLGFAVGIWIVEKRNITVVWTAYRDDKPLYPDSVVSLTKDGKLVLITEGKKKLIADATGPASYASLLDSGNFVLYGNRSEVIWTSFRYPTDTILVGQRLSAGKGLISSVSETNRSTGSYYLAMQISSDLVLYPLHSRGAYWSTKASTIFENSDVDLGLSNGYALELNFRTSNNNTIYRATLDADGFFRLYSHDQNGEFSKTVVWQAPNRDCDVYSFCGFNSYCTLDDTRPYCACLPGSDFIDPNHKSHGCARNYSEAGCRGGKENMLHFDVVPMENIEWGGFSYAVEDISVDDCRLSCLEDCNCGGALYIGQRCKKQKLPLRYVRRVLSNNDGTKTTALVKVGLESIDGFGTNDFLPPKPPVIVAENEQQMIQILLLTIGLVLFSSAALVASGVFAFKSRAVRYSRFSDHRNDGLIQELTVQSFTYKELRKVTNGFSERLGKGSFGAVYKGTLKSKKFVAVKRLEKLVEEGEKEFQAEMRAIGRTHHKNLVRLLGYCADGSNRLLVYEFMSNGSLANLLFMSETKLDWNARVRIALDIAKGIVYLHEECEAPIIHCDIKPQNILMDDHGTAKVCDFGLAKFLMPDQTRTMTIVRGTRGYLAPEWYKNAPMPISLKVDVYSYGIMLLEIIFCRRNIQVTFSELDEILLSAWAYKCLIGGELQKLVAGEEVDMKTLENMTKVALWCIQDEPTLRPSMKSVILMLEGIAEVPPPPRPDFTP